MGGHERSRRVFALTPINKNILTTRISWSWFCVGQKIHSFFNFTHFAVIFSY